MLNNKTKVCLSVLLLLFGVLCRLLPHTWNFTPIIAISLFAGVYLGRAYALLLPLATILVSDFFLGFYEWQLLFAVYGSYLLIGLGSQIIKRYKSVETVLAGTIVSALLFFLITNFAVWYFSPWYAKDLAGVLECYTLALPFFRNTLLSSVFFSGALFSSYELAMFIVKSKTKEIAKQKLIVE